MMQDPRLEWLKPKMDGLFEIKAKQEKKGLPDFNTRIQEGREYRNPRICERLVENFKIRQYGTNFPKEKFDPDYWKNKQPEGYYDSSMYRRLLEKRERQMRSDRDAANKYGNK